MSCGNTSEVFSDHGLGIVTVRMLELLKEQVQQYSGVVNPGYLAMLVGAIDQVTPCLQIEPLTHKDVVAAHRKLGLIKEPLAQLRFEVIDDTENVKLILTVFALHELYNALSKLVDALHSFSHVEDHITLDDLDFRTAIQRHLGEIFGRDDN